MFLMSESFLRYLPETHRFGENPIPEAVKPHWQMHVYFGRNVPWSELRSNDTFGSDNNTAVGHALAFAQVVQEDYDRIVDDAQGDQGKEQTEFARLFWLSADLSQSPESVKLAKSVLLNHWFHPKRNNINVIFR